MKKNWKSHKITEHIYGTVINRWYIKSPSDNYYMIYRSQGCLCQSTGPDMYDYECLKGRTFHEAIKEIYEMEESDTYDKNISDYVENTEECKTLFKQGHGFNITTY